MDRVLKLVKALVAATISLSSDSEAKLILICDCDVAWATLLSAFWEASMDSLASRCSRALKLVVDSGTAVSSLMSAAA